ncbi:hypothetical protein MIND_00466200 [Mycena indigotica]|uniref:Alginate lyase domain-containing protein n=1 Tax=Mycena indigotica TaxID=2126181 RepID=A0A8H6SZI6_9AGAR|nr:uncharacterized protein MIND_00466200 [Mycena indigotica]KAF7306745.1 hypothetical protein MIND_00466200 [Mycena indigotica]
MTLPRLAILLALTPFSRGDIVDWVNVDYISKQTRTTALATKDAQNAVVSMARSTAANGPWTMTKNPQGVSPPSKDSHDYLSWAPYHWPQCNWCPAKTSGKQAQRGMSRQRRRSEAETEHQALLFFSTPTQLSELEEAAASKGKAPACTPSPTKPMPPSATWTTCPYEVQDGKVNPDVRTLTGPPSIVHVSDSVFYNAHCFALKGTRSCSQDAVRFIQAYFLTSSTKMNPNVNFGQIVRGPGQSGQQGAFTGVLDIRGIVKIVNAILVLKSAKSPDWTNTIDNAMTQWLSQYAKWLQASDIGKSVAGKANNHVTFYAVQLAAVLLASGDSDSAASTLNWYFQNKFREQIAKSGEQPFEAVRTRPFHYRCFHLEGLIAAAKLGDWLGLNFWQATSKYGATIQDAVDFTMRVDPKDEDATELLPHVAAIAAVYGDPKGSYAKFMKNLDSGYQKEPVWFYNQREAFTQASGRKAGNTRDAATCNPTCKPTDLIPFLQEYGFELESGLYVTCGMVAPYFCADDLPSVDSNSTSVDG